MLAKIAPPTNDFLVLARYLVHGKPGTKTDPRRVAWVMAQNLPSDDPELVARYMTATAGLSPRTRNAAYHLMIAWHARERPSTELMQEVARETLIRAGLAEHQALIMGHGDKPHPHLHILLNRVHPETGRAWKTSHDFARFDAIMKELAAAYGCEYSPAHVYNPELTEDEIKRPNSRATYAARRGAKTARPQWSRRTARVLGASLSEDLTPASTLDDVADAIATHGLRLEAKGHGFVVGNDQGYVKLSSLKLAITAHAMPRRVRGSPVADGCDALFAPRVRRSSLWAPDGVDITRAMVTLGVADQDDVTAAIRRAIDDRASRRMQREASRSSTLSSPVRVQLRRPDRGSRPARSASR